MVISLIRRGVCQSNWHKPSSSLLIILIVRSSGIFKVVNGSTKLCCGVLDFRMLGGCCTTAPYSSKTFLQSVHPDIFGTFACDNTLFLGWKRPKHFVDNVQQNGDDTKTCNIRLPIRFTGKWLQFAGSERVYKYIFLFY